MSDPSLINIKSIRPPLSVVLMGIISCNDTPKSLALA